MALLIDDEAGARGHASAELIDDGDDGRISLADDAGGVELRGVAGGGGLGAGAPVWTSPMGAVASTSVGCIRLFWVAVTALITPPVQLLP